MSFWNRLFSKKSVGRSALVVSQIGQAAHSPRNLRTFMTEGYQKNVIAFRCIQLIARSAMRVPLKLMKTQHGENVEITEHPMLDLLYKPNPLQGYAGLVEEFVSFYGIAGNGFIESVYPVLDTENLERPKSPPSELWVLPPQFMNIAKGDRGLPLAYRYRGMGSEAVFPVGFNGESRILHMKTFNPTDIFWGLSPFDPASYQVDMHNAASQWNYSLLKNSAAPSGVIQVEGELDEEQRNELRQNIQDIFSGPRNTGRPLLLENGSKWTSMGFNMREMDFVKGRSVSTREIALAFGVPEQLVSVPEAQKYDNNEMAKEALYTDTVIPLMESFAEHLTNFLSVQYNDTDLWLTVDRNNIPALEGMRRRRFEKAVQATFLTPNEQREVAGYGAYEPGESAADKLYVNAGLIPIDMASDDYSSDDSDTSDYVDPDDDDTDDDDKGTPGAFDIKAKKKSRWRQKVREIRKHERALASQVRGVFSIEQRNLQNAVSTLTSNDRALLEFVVTDVISETEPKMRRVLETNMRKTMQAFAKPILDMAKSQCGMETKVDFGDWENYLSTFIANHVGQKIKGIAKTSRNQVLTQLRKEIAEGMAEGDIGKEMAERVAGVYKRFKDPKLGRATTIARTETHIASQTATIQAAKASNVKMKKQWVAPPYVEGRSRENHVDVDQVIVGIDEQFSVPVPKNAKRSGPDLMDHPGDPLAPADQVINCRCQVIEVFE